MRRLEKIIAGFIAISLSLWAVLVWIWADPPSVPLTRELPRETAMMSEAFNARVQTFFHIGMLESDVVRELEAQGFKQVDWTGQPKRGHIAKRYDGGAPVCGLEAWVSWQSGENGHIQGISGTYSVTCL